MKLYHIGRKFKFFWQRLVRGFDDSETWNLDHSLAKLIAPRLRRFKEISNSSPVDLELVDWHKQLDQMIESLEFIGSSKYWGASPEELQKHQENFEILFARNYFKLWW